MDGHLTPEFESFRAVAEVRRSARSFLPEASCPLEGFDEPKVKRLFALPDEARVVMVIAAGRRGPHTLIPQIRHERAFYIERV